MGCPPGLRVNAWGINREGKQQQPRKNWLMRTGMLEGWMKMRLVFAFVRAWLHLKNVSMISSRAMFLLQGGTKLTAEDVMILIGSDVKRK